MDDDYIKYIDGVNILIYCGPELDAHIVPKVEWSFFENVTSAFKMSGRY